MIRNFIYGLLVVLFIYLVNWTYQLNHFNKRQKRVKRMQELRAKGNEAQQHTIDENQDKEYWYNVREINDCTKEEEKVRFYHFFSCVEEGVQGLLLEMYDCGIVRTDELSKLAYGDNHMQDVDLSFLEDFEHEDRRLSNDADVEEDESEFAMDAIVQVDGVMGGFFSSKETSVVEAAKKLKEDDPGITDIKGTLSEGVVDILSAVDAENEANAKAQEPILIKKEKSVEEARRTREKTATAEIRNKIYEHWASYVSELYDQVFVNADEDTKQKIQKALMDYGYNDIDVLLESPE